MDDALYDVLPGLPHNINRVDEAALWFRLPSLCSFVANLCSCSWLGEHTQRADELKQAAASALRLVQHALCVLLLGCDPRMPAPQITMFPKTLLNPCECFLPFVLGPNARCFTCCRDTAEHALHQFDASVTPSDDFFVELCRVGSVGWDSHAFMHAVHGRTHLGTRTKKHAYTAKEAQQSQDMFKEHLRQLLQGGPINCQECLSVTVSAEDLHGVTVFSENGQMLPLLQHRRDEIEHMCSIIEKFVVSKH